MRSAEEEKEASPDLTQMCPFPAIAMTQSTFLFLTHPPNKYSIKNFKPNVSISFFVRYVTEHSQLYCLYFI